MKKAEWVKPQINEMYTHIYLCPEYKEFEEPQIFKMPIEQFIHAFNRKEFTSDNCFVTKDLFTMRDALGVSEDYELDIYE